MGKTHGHPWPCPAKTAGYSLAWLRCSVQT